ncbi:MAG: hypothetical protein DMG38_05305 [Acidobacteria bacterium]|nr:MAG: hypothetical protein DMG38_05305 [Acidobacteriota bacterium]
MDFFAFDKAYLDKCGRGMLLMLENRSFDHMPGALMDTDKRIGGVDPAKHKNPDATGEMIPVQPLAEFQGQLDPDPRHHFPGVDLQIFGGALPGPARVANMQGFVKSYFQQQQDVDQSHKNMYYFPLKKMPVLTGLAHGFSPGLALRAGGFPQLFRLFSWGGKEGTHTIANVNTSLLGGSARPSLDKRLNGNAEVSTGVALVFCDSPALNSCQQLFSSAASIL